MKWNLVIYIVIIVIILALIITGGFLNQNIVWELEHYKSPMAVERVSTTISPLNSIIVLVIISSILIITMSNKNKLKNKWSWFFLILLIALLLVPVGEHAFHGGAAGIRVYRINMLMELLIKLEVLI